METTGKKTDCFSKFPFNQEYNSLKIKTRTVRIMTLNKGLSSYSTAVKLFKMRVLMNRANISLDGCKKLVFT